MRPANLVFMAFRPSSTYCPKCRRAMITPTVVLLLFAIGILSIAPLRFYGLIR